MWLKIIKLSAFVFVLLSASCLSPKSEHWAYGEYGYDAHKMIQVDESREGKLLPEQFKEELVQEYRDYRVIITPQNITFVSEQSSRKTWEYVVTNQDKNLFQFEITNPPNDMQSRMTLFKGDINVLKLEYKTVENPEAYRTSRELYLIKK